MIRVVFAQIDGDDVPDPGNFLQSWNDTLGTRRELEILLVILLALSIGLFAWAMASSRRRRRHHKHHRHRHAPIAEAAGADIGMAEERESRRDRRHRRRREHRPRNPTLAETGGLPPIRDKDAPPPGP